MSPVVSRGLAQISLEDPEHMRTLAEQAAEDLADAPAEEVIRWAVDTFGDRICVTSSMTDAVIIHLASAVHPGIDVVFLAAVGAVERNGPGVHERSFSLARTVQAAKLSPGSRAAENRRSTRST